MNKIFKKFIAVVYYIIERPILTSFVILLLSALVIAVLSWQHYVSIEDFGAQILVEAHGMLFDIAIIGILMYWLNQNGEIRQRIRSYLNEIDDFRLWRSEESAFRIVGNIRRLNRHKIYDINLANCHLLKTNLSYVNLAGANLNSANLSNCSLVEISFEGARMNQTNFENANLNSGNLKGAYATGSNFQDAYMIKVNLQNAFLIKANMRNAYLMEADMQNAYLMGTDLCGANLFKADLRGAKGLTIEQLAETKSLYEALLDEPLLEEVRKVAPHLIEA